MDYEFLLKIGGFGFPSLFPNYFENKETYNLGSPTKGGKMRNAFFLLTTPLVRATRKAGNNSRLLRHHARY